MQLIFEPVPIGLILAVNIYLSPILIDILLRAFISILVLLVLAKWRASFIFINIIPVIIIYHRYIPLYIIYILNIRNQSSLLYILSVLKTTVIRLLYYMWLRVRNDV